MDRRRKVDDLFESVKGIGEPDAFRHVIGAESDDNVLADLRERLWDGRGDKPWQVKEVNRELTERQRVRPPLPPAAGPEPGAKSPSLKERIENNLPIFFASALLTGFLAGLGTYQGTLKLIDYTTVPSETLRLLKEGAAAKSEQRWLRIRGVDGLDGSRARIVARVNGRAYSYPSRTVWSQLAPTMPGEDFPLPADARGYDVSFELLLLSATGEFQQFQSQEVVSVRTYPFESEYKIFGLKVDKAGPTRGIALERSPARIAFELR